MGPRSALASRSTPTAVRVSPDGDADRGLGRKFGPHQDLVYGDGAELLEQGDAIFDSQLRRRRIRIVEDDVVDVVLLEEVVKWFAYNRREFLETTKVAAVSTPDHCLAGIVRHKIRVHGG